MSALYIKVGHRRGDFHLGAEFTLPARGVTALLGPSGSGKSTLLRMIAGLERPRHGCIERGGVPWFDAEHRIHLPPQRRRVGYVFQDYALFAHLTVAENVGYGLPRAKRAAEIGRWLDRLHLAPLAGRYPHQLSGGQRQRVALARALAPNPDVLLLDEPFSAVDAALRQRLRAELLETLAVAARPVVLVSHDLDDARYLAEQVGVLVDGRLECFGATNEVLARPASAAAARVLGWRNLLPVRAIEGPKVSGGWGALTLEREPPVDTAWLGVRPEHLKFNPPASGGLHARMERIIELGAIRNAQCRLNDDTLVEIHRPWDEPLPAPGEIVTLTPAHASLLALPNIAPLPPDANVPDYSVGDPEIPLRSMPISDSCRTTGGGLIPDDQNARRIYG